MTKQFSFETNILGVRKSIYFTAVEENGFIRTSDFRPDILIKSAIINVVNWEAENEFVLDCRLYASKTEEVSLWTKINPNINNPFIIHYNSLELLTIEHIKKFNRIYFNDLMIYLDVFAFFLRSSGFPEDWIKNKYLSVLKVIIDQMGNFCLCSITGLPFRLTPMYKKIANETGNISLETLFS